MPTPPSLIECLISSFIRNSVFLRFRFPSLVATCIFETCLQFTPHWPFITHVDDLPTHFIVNNNLVSLSAALYHDYHSFCNSTTPLAQLFPQIRSGFATLSLCGSANPSGSFLVWHTQAPTFLSQRSHIVFPLSSSVDTRYD